MLVHCRHEFYHNQLTYYIAKARDLSIDLQQKNLSIFFCIFRLTILSEYYILLKSHRTKPNCVKVARQTLTLFVRVRILLRLPHCPETVRFRGFFFFIIDLKKRPLVP